LPERPRRCATGLHLGRIDPRNVPEDLREHAVEQREMRAREDESVAVRSERSARGRDGLARSTPLEDARLNEWNERRRTRLSHVDPRTARPDGAAVGAAARGGRRREDSDALRAALRDGASHRLDQVEDLQAGARPSIARGDRAGRIAAHDDRGDALPLQKGDVRREQRAQLVVAAISVRHVPLVRKIDEVLAGQ